MISWHAFFLALGLSSAANGQLLTQTDPHPFGETGRPVGLAGSAFEVWVAYPQTLLQFRRMGEDSPQWFGTPHGLPSEGIVAICFDEPTQSLWIHSVSNRWLRWSSGMGSAREETPPVGGCTSRLSKSLNPSTITNLTPASPGWLRMGSELIDPRGVRIRILQAMSLDDRELWLATDAGVWSGRSVTGRIDQRPAGLAENCITRLASEASGTIWLQGCLGSFTALIDESPRATFLASDPRNADLRSPRLLGRASNGGVWVSVFDGLVRLTTDGIAERLLTRKAPFGGRALSSLEIADTLWVGTQNSLCYRVRSKAFFADIPPWNAPQAVNALLPTPLGILAATNNGFWLRSTTGWVRPTWLQSAENRTVLRASLEPVEPYRVAWWDGREVRIDTLPGHPGHPDRWLPGRTPLRSLAFDQEGRLHMALSGSWLIWDSNTGEQREWKAGLGIDGDIYDVLPGTERAILAGIGGGSSVRLPTYTPPNNPK